MKPTVAELSTLHDVAEHLFEMGLANAISSDYWSFLDENRYELNRMGAKWFTGETKICFKFASVPYWIIKVGFPREHDAFTDYCVQELETYNEVCGLNLQHFLAATYLLDEWEGVPVIIQEAVDIHSSWISDAWSTYSNKDSWEMTLEDQIYAIFGENDETEFLINYFYDREERFHINADLHSGNWGYRIIDDSYEPVIFDFVGYANTESSYFRSDYDEDY